MIIAGYSETSRYSLSKPNSTEIKSDSIPKEKPAPVFDGNKDDNTPELSKEPSNEYENADLRPAVRSLFKNLVYIIKYFFSDEDVDIQKN